MYAPAYTLFSGVVYRIFSGGQINLVQWATTTFTKEAGKAKAGWLRGTGTVRYWLDNARPSRAPQGHAGMAGQDKMQRGRLRPYLERPTGVGWYFR